MKFKEFTKGEQTVQLLSLILLLGCAFIPMWLWKYADYYYLVFLHDLYFLIPFYHGFIIASIFFLFFPFKGSRIVSLVFVSAACVVRIGFFFGTGLLMPWYAFLCEAVFWLSLIFYYAANAPIWKKYNLIKGLK